VAEVVVGVIVVAVAVGTAVMASLLGVVRSLAGGVALVDLGGADLAGEHVGGPESGGDGGFRTTTTGEGGGRRGPSSAAQPAPSSRASTTGTQRAIMARIPATDRRRISNRLARGAGVGARSR
jgi:hypothetical protein